MDTPMLEYVIQRLQDCKGRWPAVAEGSGISIRTLEKIARRESPNPRIEGVQKLHDYLRGLETESAA